MVQCCHCFYCGESSVPAGGFITTVQLNSPKMCGECYHSKDRKIELFFCSPAHMVEYMKEHGETLAAKAAEMAPLKNFPYRQEGQNMVNLLLEIPRAEATYKPIKRQVQKDEGE